MYLQGVCEMDTIERVMSYLADMRERGDDRAKELFQALADLPEPEFEPVSYTHLTLPTNREV